MDEIIENLFIGDLEDARTAPANMVILSVSDTIPSLELENQPIDAYNIPILRYENQQVAISRRQLNKVAEDINYYLQRNWPVLVNCTVGIVQSPLAVVWFLYTRREMSFDDAYKLVQSKRPQVQRRDEWLR